MDRVASPRGQKSFTGGLKRHILQFFHRVCSESIKKPGSGSKFQEYGARNTGFEKGEKDRESDWGCVYMVSQPCSQVMVPWVSMFEQSIIYRTVTKAPLPGIKSTVYILGRDQERFPNMDLTIANIFIKDETFLHI